MSTLALKIVVTPLLIGAASLAGRRWGPAISGWLVGLPLTSGPITFFLALSQGASFAAAAATGVLAGTISQAAFCLAYAHVGRRLGWLACFLAGCAGFAVATLVLQRAPLPPVPLYLVVVSVLVTTLLLLPRGEKDGVGTSAPPRWDLPARMVVATVFVVALTEIASALGPRLTGLLAPFPLYASILAVFAHRAQGAGAAVRVLRGLQVGLFGFASFFLTLGVLLERMDIAFAFGAAIAVALVVQGASLALLVSGNAASHMPDETNQDTSGGSPDA